MPPKKKSEKSEKGEVEDKPKKVVTNKKPEIDLEKTNTTKAKAFPKEKALPKVATPSPSSTSSSSSPIPPPYPPSSSLPYVEIQAPIQPHIQQPIQTLASANMSTKKAAVFQNFRRHPVNRALTFDINGIDLGVVNALRRIITSELPHVGIEFNPYDEEKSDIRFIENTSSLHNEFLGHRISMIPLKLDENEIENFQKEKYNFEIKKHNTTKDKLAVTSDDIRITDEYGEERDKAFHEKVFPRSPITGDPILIVILNENIYNPEYGEKLHVKFKASIGISQKHSRYSPVSTCAFHNITDNEKAKKAKEIFVKARESERVNALMTKMTKIKKEGRIEEKEKDKDASQNQARLEKRFAVHDIYRHFKTNEYDEPCAFSFTIETESRLSEKYLVHKGLIVLIQKLQKIIDEKRFKITALSDDAFSILIKGEQHTAGNLIQVMFYNKFVREQQTLAFVGYYLVHPLVEEIILKMKFKKNENAEEFFKNGLEMIQDNLKKLQLTWKHEFRDSE